MEKENIGNEEVPRTPEETNNTVEYSFLKSMENDTLLSDTIRNQDLIEQFSQNTIGRLELEESLRNENIVMTDELISNNSIDYLTRIFNSNPDRFYECFGCLEIDENFEKFEKLANIAILLKFDHNRICECMKQRDVRKRYVSTFILINMMVFSFKTGKNLEPDKISNKSPKKKRFNKKLLKEKHEQQKKDETWTQMDILGDILARAKDTDDKVRAMVIKNILLFYEYEPDSVLRQLIVSMRDPKVHIQTLAFSHIKTIFKQTETREILVDQLVQQIINGLPVSISQIIGDFLFEYFVETKNEKSQFYILPHCSSEKISNVIKKYKKSYKEAPLLYHMLYIKCSVNIFENISFTKKEKNKYFQFILQYYTKSQICCDKEECHLKILHKMKYNDLENISRLLETIRENRSGTKILIDLLIDIKPKVFVDYPKTPQLLKLIANSPQNHCPEFFTLLKKLYKNFEFTVDEILPQIKHKELIIYFNTDPIDDIGVIYKACWNIKENKYDQIENLKFSSNMATMKSVGLQESHVEIHQGNISEKVPSSHIDTEKNNIQDQNEITDEEKGTERSNENKSKTRNSLESDLNPEFVKDISEYSTVLKFLIEQIRNNESKIANQEAQEMVNAMKSVLRQTIDHISNQMDNFSKNTNFYEFLITFLSYGYFRSESTRLYNSPSNLKVFLKKCKDIPLLIDTSLNYLVSTQAKKNIREISNIIAVKLKRQPTVHLFNKLKEMCKQKVEMMNTALLINFISLDERIILENMATGEFKAFLKSKCTE